MEYAENILGTIGNTPMVKLNKLVEDLPCLVLAKYETFNPGNSVKDRMALKMVKDAEAQGLLKPGGTIIEGTSGNTGMGLALACIEYGYKLICVLSDKQSKEKMDILRAVGAEVVVCPTNVDADDPRSYYSVSKRLAAETPNSWYVNQYDNPKYAKVVKDLKKRLKQLRKRVGDTGEDFPKVENIINEFWDYDEDARKKAIEISHEYLAKKQKLS